MAQYVADGDLDDTLPMPALDRMLEASEAPLGEEYESSAQKEDMLAAQLRRLVELSESIDGRLGLIADLLTEKSPPRRSTNTQKKTSKKTAKRSSTKRSSSETA